MQKEKDINTDNGWICLHRKLLENPISEKANYLAVWVYLLLSANHKDKWVIWNNKKTLIKRGSFIGSISKISKKFKISTGTVSNILKYLISENMIEKSSNFSFTLFTIANYDAYQDRVESKTESELKAGCKRVETTNNNNNNNNEDNIDISTNTLVAKPSASASFSYEMFLEFFNSTVGTMHRGDTKSKGSFKARLKEGFSPEEIKQAVVNAKKDRNLMGENDAGRRYLTPEYILRSDKLDNWLSSAKGKRSGWI